MPISLSVVAICLSTELEVSNNNGISSDLPAQLPNKGGPKNMHAKFPNRCDAHFNSTSIVPYSYLLYDIINGPKSAENYMTGNTSLLDFGNIIIPNANGHASFKGDGTLRDNVYHLARLQACLYESVERFNVLSREYNITRWAAHGGSAMSAICSHSMNLWDDDIDVTVSSCQGMNDIYDSSQDVINTQNGFIGKVLPGDDSWVLYKKQFPKAYRFKLKPRSQFTVIPNNEDVSGLDIMCFDEGITANEVQPLQKSGFRDYRKWRMKLKQPNSICRVILTLMFMFPKLEESNHYKRCHLDQQLFSQFHILSSMSMFQFGTERMNFATFHSTNQCQKQRTPSSNPQRNHLK